MSTTSNSWPPVCIYTHTYIYMHAPTYTHADTPAARQWRCMRRDTVLTLRFTRSWSGLLVLGPRGCYLAHTHTRTHAHTHARTHKHTPHPAPYAQRLLAELAAGCRFGLPQILKVHVYFLHKTHPRGLLRIEAVSRPSSRLPPKSDQQYLCLPESVRPLQSSLPCTQSQNSAN